MDLEETDTLFNKYSLAVLSCRYDNKTGSYEDIFGDLPRLDVNEYFPDEVINWL
ncbi:hypothetical protein GOV13_01550 [Candidatus Pacearchaeota archaeon]|nr:hypothetical protein [Candidatus Pacearchaeota archaeon]